MSVTSTGMTITPLVISNPEKMYANSLTTLLLVGAKITYECDGRVARIERVEAAAEGKLFVQVSGCYCGTVVEEISVATPLSIMFACYQGRVPDAMQLSLADDFFSPVQCIQASPEL